MSGMYGMLGMSGHCQTLLEPQARADLKDGNVRDFRECP